MQRTRALDIQGVSLHSYRYAWAERARKCGYPARIAQEAPPSQRSLAAEVEHFDMARQKLIGRGRGFVSPARDSRSATGSKSTS